jgi:hypothetical protein
MRLPTLPATGVLPIAFTRVMAKALLLGMPRPLPNQPQLDAISVDDAFALVRVLAPRDAFEAQLVQQIVLAMLRVPQAFALAAAHEGDLKAMMKYEKLGLSYSRQSGAMERRLRQYRAMRGDVPAAASAVWAYELAELVGVWREGLGLEVGEAAREAVTGDAAALVAGTDRPAAAVNPLLRRAMDKRARKEAARAAMVARQMARAGVVAAA